MRIPRALEVGWVSEAVGGAPEDLEQVDADATSRAARRAYSGDPHDAQLR